MKPTATYLKLAPFRIARSGVALALCLAAWAALSAPSQAQVRTHGEGGGHFSLNVMSWRDIPFRSVVRQQYDYSCGSAAVATLLTYHYRTPRTEAEVFQAMYEAGDKKRIEAQGFSLLEMKLYLESQGYRADGFRMSYEALAGLNAPSIAMINTGNYRHFVVVKGVADSHILVGDPMLGLRTYKRADLLFDNLEWLREIVSDAARPVVFILAVRPTRCT